MKPTIKHMTMRNIAINQWIAAAAAVTALTACSKDPGPTGRPAAAELRLSSSIEVQTRGTHGLDTRLKPGETIHVWVDDHESGTALYENNLLTQQDDGSLTGGESMYFPQTGGSVDIYALHGSVTWNGNTYPDSELSHTVASDQRSEITAAGKGYHGSDLAYAKLADVSRNGSPTTAALSFKHLLSKVEVVLIAGNGMEGLAGRIGALRLLNTLPTAGLTLDKGSEPYGNNADRSNGIALTANGTPTPIRLDSDLSPASAATTAADRIVNEAIVVPQTLAPGTPLLEVETTDGELFTYTPEQETAFESGKSYRYIITISQRGLDVQAEIGGEWTDGGTVDVKPTELFVYKTDLSQAKIGDFYMADGRLIELREAQSLPYELHSSVVAIVFAVGQSDWDFPSYGSTGIGQNACHGYAVALKDNPNPEYDSSAIAWGKTGQELGCYHTDNYSKPALEFEGYFYTQRIIEEAEMEGGLSLNPNNFPATYLAVHYEEKCPAPKTSTGWFLPSIGQLRAIYLNRDILKSIPGAEMGAAYYWSSSEWGEGPKDTALTLAMYDGAPFRFAKNYSGPCVRAVLAF